MTDKKYPRKLTLADITHIHELRAKGYTHRRIAELKKVSRRHIGDVLNGETWKWLK